MLKAPIVSSAVSSAMAPLSRRRKKLLLAFLSAHNLFMMASSLWLVKMRKDGSRRWWVDPVLRNRSVEGAFNTVFLKYKEQQQERFFGLTRMTVPQFEELLDIVKEDLQKKSFREFLTPEFRLAFTVCFLASGTLLVRMAEYWLIGKSTAYGIVKETCEAIWSSLKSSHLSPPSENDWKNIADGFWSRWNLPNCCGALDGKHIRIQCPVGSGSQFFNYKQFFSDVLLALCDSNYCFTWIELGDYGSLPDAHVFRACNLNKAMENGSISFPGPAALPGTNVNMRYFIVGDEAFPLRTDLMRPFARRNINGEKQRIFNYRLSRGRLTIENSFAVLASRWRVLRTALAHSLDTAEKIVLATMCLHNFIMKREEHLRGFKQYCPPSFVDHVNEQGEIELGE